MGALYKSTMLTKQNMKREFVLERLQEKGITHSQEGKPLNELSYEDLKFELVMSAFREIDAFCDSGKWF